MDEEKDYDYRDPKNVLPHILIFFLLTEFQPRPPIIVVIYFHRNLQNVRCQHNGWENSKCNRERVVINQQAHNQYNEGHFFRASITIPEA